LKHASATTKWKKQTSEAYLFWGLRCPTTSKPEQSATGRGANATSRDLDLSGFYAAPLIAFTAAKETDSGTETDGRIPPECGADRADQWADAQASG